MLKAIKPRGRGGVLAVTAPGRNVRRKNAEKRFTKRVKQKEKFADLSPALPSGLEEFCLQC